jgi:hypothetical protein
MKCLNRDLGLKTHIELRNLRAAELIQQDPQKSSVSQMGFHISLFRITQITFLQYMKEKDLPRINIFNLEIMQPFVFTSSENTLDGIQNSYPFPDIKEPYIEH